MQFLATSLAAATIFSSAMAMPAPALYSKLQQRGATDTYGDYTGQTSSFPDGSGSYVRSDDVHRYASGDKCWTDLFYVSSSTENQGWVKRSTIDCKTSSECELGLENGIESCTTWNLAVSVSADISIIKDIFSVSASTTIENGGSECRSVSTTSDCHWDDTQCHALWTSNVVKVNHGYIRRRCNFQSDDKGDVTVWSKDWDITEAAQYANAGCAASCTDSSYPA